MDVGLLEARDQDIWKYALDTDSVLITKDEDFITIRALSGRGPAIVWVRFGNPTRSELLRRFTAVFADVLAALNRGDTVIEVSDR